MTLKALARACLLAILAVASVRGRARATAAAPSDLNANFVGDWTGQLEYRDYSSNERVFLPTWLKVTEAVDHRSLIFSYVYDDGPTKIVRERLVFALDSAAHKVTTTDQDESSKGETTTTTYDVSGLEEFAKTGRGVLRLTGDGTDNDKRVEVRLTITLRRNLYSSRKEVRPAGSTDEKDFQFRDGYVFTRAQSPAAP
jgi:hypothetical protein